ncbi:MAG: hypothetical protein IPJ20_21030 [Flammeovirgaceae bacterium]|nr:hypothetical protein [Flammeovirgaceae bacterium]
MDFYLVFVVILMSLAVVDLMVGVSNDAVNFLNSAVGSKVASFRVILIVASLGILAGSLFKWHDGDCAKWNFQSNLFHIRQSNHRVFSGDAY